MSDKVKKLNSVSDLQQSNLVLVDFYSDQCRICPALIPALEQLADSRPDIDVRKMNVVDDPIFVLESKVHSLPTLALFKNGELVWKNSGLIKFDDLMNSISSFLKE